MGTINGNVFTTGLSNAIGHLIATDSSTGAKGQVAIDLRSTAPVAVGATATYTGTLQQVITEYTGGTAGPPSTSTSAATVTSSIAAGTTFRSYNPQFAVTFAEQDVGTLSTQTATNTTFESLVSGSPATLVSYGSLFSNSYGAQRQTVLQSPSQLDSIPEQTQTWSPVDAAQYREVELDGTSIVGSINTDGSYSQTDQLPGSSETFAVYSDLR